MCRVFLLMNRNGNVKTDKWLLAMHMISNAAQQNKDGYALAYWKGGQKRDIRTLDLNKFVRWLFEHKQEMTDSDVIFGHLRQSTNVVSEEFVHGWEIGGFVCGHNGLVNKNKLQNDSLEYFQNVVEKEKTFGLTIQQAVKNYMEKNDNFWGAGTFIMANGEEQIVVEYKNNGTVALMNSEIILAASNKDIFDFNKKSITISETTKKISVGKIDFEETHKKKIKLENPLNKDNGKSALLRMDLGNEIVTFKDGTAIERIKIERADNITYYGTGGHENIYDDYYQRKDFRKSGSEIVTAKDYRTWEEYGGSW